MPKLWSEEDKIIDLSDINPNQMFAMSYNFELLKYVITSLIRNQQNYDNQINDLKYSFLKQQKYSTELELSIIDLKMQREETPEVLDELLKQKKEAKLKNEEYKKEIDSLEKEKQEEKIPKKIPLYTMKEIIPQIPQDMMVISDMNKTQQNIINEKKDELKDTQKDEEKKEDLEKEDKKEKEKEKVGEEKIEKEKIIEEEKKIVTPPPSIVASQAKSTENEKSKNLNDDLQKQLQLIVGELKNIKSKQQTLDKDFSLFKLNITEQIKEKLVNDIPSMIDSTFENRISSLQKNIKKDFDKINEELNNKNNTHDQKLSDLKDIISKEISLKDEKSNGEFEQIKNDYFTLRENLSLTNEKLSNMVTTLSFNNLKKEINEKIENEKKILNLEISILKSNVNNIKNQLFDHLSDSRDHDNLVSLMKIMDSISNNIQRLMDFKKTIEEKEKRKAIADNNKYVKQDGFNEAINNIHKHMDTNKKEFSEIRFDLDEIKSKDLIIKANLNDLKNLEDSVLSKMEALKVTIKDNFVEKNMLVKNLKYLELQIKQLIEENNKKSEKKESWLLAKKPFNGHLCASCEAYIGDLKPNTNSKFIAWNKYPAKDPIDKIFRINAGFSKVLQMINQDRNERSKSNSLNESKEERNCSSAEAERIKIEKIPKFKGKSRDKQLKQNNSCTQIDDNDFAGSLPKISVKKSNKLSSDNIFSEDINKTTSNGAYIKSYMGKNSARIYPTKSRKLVEENEDENKTIKKIEEIIDDENIESQKPKITKVFRKLVENGDKKSDNDKV